MANPSLNTPRGILSFPTFFQPKSRSEGNEPVYSGTIIFSPERQATTAYKALVEACVAAAKKEWGLNVNLKTVKMPFRDGAEKAGQWAGYNDGDVFINPWTKNRPTIVDNHRETVTLPEEVWAGQEVRMNVSPFAWTNSGKKGVSLALNHVQIVRNDMPRIDGRGSASDVFDDGEVDEEEDAPF